MSQHDDRDTGIIALRAAYLSAEAEAEKWKNEVRHAEARAYAAEREVEEKERLIAAWNETINAMVERCKAAERARDEAVAALRLAEPYLAYAAEPEPCYGSFHGGDPRDFTPDPECSTEEEREKHRRACEVWEAQAEPMALRDTHSLVKNESGEVVGHVARSGFGLGTYLRRDKRAVKALDAARRALAASTGEAK